MPYLATTPSFGITGALLNVSPALTSYVNNQRVAYTMAAPAVMLPELMSVIVKVLEFVTVTE
jgi:hypothetical protein